MGIEEQEQMIKLGNHTWLTRPCEETDRPVLAYVAGSTRSLLFDAGNSPRHAADLKAALVSSDLREPDWITISHAHYDHWFGLADFTGTTLSSVKTSALVQAAMALDWTCEGLWSRIREGNEKEYAGKMLDAELGRKRSAFPLRAPDITVTGITRFDLGGVSCIFEPVGGSHADDASILFIEEDRILMLGDLLYIKDAKRATIDALFAVIERYDAEYFIDSHDSRILGKQEMAGIRNELYG